MWVATSINVLTTDLEQQCQAEPEQLEQLEQREPELELSCDIIDDSQLIIDDAEIIDDPKIDFIKLTTPLVNKNLSRSSEWDR